jgi:hypothetical protein
VKHSAKSVIHVCVLDAACIVHLLSVVWLRGVNLASMDTVVWLRGAYSASMDAVLM